MHTPSLLPAPTSLVHVAPLRPRSPVLTPARSQRLHHRSRTLVPTLPGVWLRAMAFVTARMRQFMAGVDPRHPRAEDRPPGERLSVAWQRHRALRERTPRRARHRWRPSSRLQEPVPEDESPWALRSGAAADRSPGSPADHRLTETPPSAQWSVLEPAVRVWRRRAADAARPPRVSPSTARTVIRPDANPTAAGPRPGRAPDRSVPAETPAGVPTVAAPHLLATGDPAAYPFDTLRLQSDRLRWATPAPFTGRPRRSSGSVVRFATPPSRTTRPLLAREIRAPEHSSEIGDTASSRTVPPGRVAHGRPRVRPARRPIVDGSGTSAVGRRFGQAVEEGGADPARPLPAAHVPLARRILGDGPLPEVSAGPRTTRLLREAGKEAATHRSTIYLDRIPGSDQHMRAVVAHELVHVAHGGSGPRFLRDDTADGEEQEARAADGVGAAPSRADSTEPATEAEATEPADEPAVDLDELLEKITDRVLVEVERRGGRYRGVF